MGTGFTIDTPIKVAPFGVSSVISLVDDILMEQMYAYYQKKDGKEYTEISNKNDKDWRSKSTTRYLNLVNKKTKEKFEEIKSQEFTPGTELFKYYELLPSNTFSETPTKEEFLKFIKPGRIDVNIMTKLNRVNYFKKELLPKEYNDALTALKGYAESDLENSAITFSAGMNAPLYSYISEFKDFFPDENGELKKQIIIKVSDYRSAFIQGKFLAKKGIWVSQYRIESGLNCGGHAFATEGELIGPILEEFKEKKEIIKTDLYKVYEAACEKLNKPLLSKDKATVKVTYQGGLALNQETQLLYNEYCIDETGWGTPFLLAPDVINIDNVHVEKLKISTQKEVQLSHSSPLGIPFWNLMTSASEEDRKRKIAAGKPGSPCPKGFLVSTKEYTEKPICTASLKFQNRKLKEYDESEDLDNIESKKSMTLMKSCICHDLAAPATLPLGIDKKGVPCICCGPNIVNFSESTDFKNMCDHIHGKHSNVVIDSQRPHFFVNELRLYVDYFHREKSLCVQGFSDKTDKYFENFATNLKKGIQYYKDNIEKISHYLSGTKETFSNQLNEAQMQIDFASGETQLIAKGVSAQATKYMNV